MNTIEELRNFLKSEGWREWDQLERDQNNGVPAPALQKPFPRDGIRIDLVPPIRN